MPRHGLVQTDGWLTELQVLVQHTHLALMAHMFHTLTLHIVQAVLGHT